MRDIGPLIDLDESENLSSEKDTDSESSECTVLEKEISSYDVKTSAQNVSTPQDNTNEILHEKKCNMINYEITMHEIEGQKRQDCIIKAQIPNQTVVNVGEILIRLEFHQPGSYLNRSLKEFLEISCFKSTDLVILDLSMKSKDGDCRLSWNFDTSKELDVDCTLGSDFLFDMNISPVKAIKPKERLIIISGDKMTQN